MLILKNYDTFLSADLIEGVFFFFSLTELVEEENPF